MPQLSFFNLILPNIYKKYSQHLKWATSNAVEECLDCSNALSVINAKHFENAKMSTHQPQRLKSDEREKLNVSLLHFHLTHKRKIWGYEKRQKKAELMEKYSGQVTVQEILDMYDDPDAYFMDKTRHVSELYKKHSLIDGWGILILVIETKVG